jgi:hypothetical protein
MHEPASPFISDLIILLPLYGTLEANKCLKFWVKNFVKKENFGALGIGNLKMDHK